MPSYCFGYWFFYNVHECPCFQQHSLANWIIPRLPNEHPKANSNDAHPASSTKSVGPYLAFSDNNNTNLCTYKYNHRHPALSFHSYHIHDISLQVSWSQLWNILPPLNRAWVSCHVPVPPVFRLLQSYHPQIWNIL